MMSNDQTPAAPSLSPQNAVLQRPPGFLSALRRTRAALQWRLLLWWVLLLLLPTAVAALPFWQMLAANLDHSVYAARLAERLDLVAIADLVVRGSERHGAAIGAGGIVALALTLLLSPLLTGMTIAAVRAPRRHGFVPLLSAGAMEYGRLLRMLAWAVVPLAVVAGVATAAFDAAGKVAAGAILQADAEHASRLALLATALAFLLAHATLDAGRAILGNERRRRSVILAWAAGLKLLLRRPFALLGSYVAVTAAGLAVAAALALARVHVPALGTGGTVAAVLLTQAGVVVLGVMRAARLAALMELAR